jgi:hypothetical protein
LAWFAVAIGGCGALIGLDQISEQACAPVCDGGGDTSWATDSTVDVPGTEVRSDPDAVGTQDQSTGDSPQLEASGGETSTFEAGSQEGGADAPLDSPHESAADSGCGPTNTVQNCGACGHACASVGGGTATAACNGTSCIYTCNPGYLDCNASVGYDQDGCECATPNSTTATCCGNTCPIEHTNGLAKSYEPNPNFYDCQPIGAMNATLANEACVQFTGNPAKCSAGMCSGYPVVCGLPSPSSVCPCWNYQGPDAGNVVVAGPDQCYCLGQSGVTFVGTFK